VATTLLAASLPADARTWTGHVWHWISQIGTPDQAQAHPQTHHRHPHIKPHRVPAAKPVLATLPGSLIADTTPPPITAEANAYALHEWDGETTTLRAGATAKTPSWAAVQIDDLALAQACADGLFLVRGAPPGAPPNCGYPGGQTDLVLAWDRSRLKDAPTWADFWDVARHPGKRGLRADPRSTLEIALLADGVAPQDIYSTLATPTGTDRAFHKLDQLRPYIVWWSSAQDAARIMQTGSALMTSTPADEIAVSNAKPPPNFAAQWEQGLRQNVSWAIPRNVPSALATQTAAFLRDNAPHHDDSRSAPLPDAPALMMDGTFWQHHYAALNTRFQNWLGPNP